MMDLKQPPALSEQLWYYLDGSAQRHGGVSTEQLVTMLRRGDLDGLTAVWRTGMAEWKELGQVDELRALAAAGGEEEEEDDEEVAQEAYDPDAELVLPQPPSSGAPSKPPATTPSGTAEGGAAAGNAAAAKKKKKKKKKFIAGGGSNIYISGIPTDAIEEDIAEIFKVAGLIKVDLADKSLKIKMYKDESGAFKGDALLSFLKPESVQLAVTLRDGYEMSPGHSLSVQPAKFEIRGELVEKAAKGKEALLQRKRQKMLETRRLAEWDDALLPRGVKASTVVVLQGLFTEEEAAEANADFYANLSQDVQVECAKAGEIDKVTVFEGSEYGAVAVRFKQQDDAQRCVSMMAERSFGSSRLVVELYDGVSDYRAKAVREGSATASGGPTAESLEEQEEKLESFAQWLEADSTDDEVDPDATTSDPTTSTPTAAFTALPPN
uniref:RRM domain-containing protein n=1 Tax=Coccolithus braarudii TaxID=221442 RepID=A0A7S0LJC3_9EUKA